MLKIIRSDRKSISIEISRELEVIVRAPRRMKDSDIERFICDHREWIDKHRDIVKQRMMNRPAEPTPEEIRFLKQEAERILPDKVSFFSEIMGVEPRVIKITSAQKRLGSCSSQNSLCFSYRLMLYDEDVINYVVIHELAHIIEHNHSKRFYEVVRKFCSDYKEIERRIRW